ncbi:hypothetical protein FNV43_RR08946 [Rhamnella rubrinervis]|uniref:non-specific serine/threonine protein kinase n=1 Tax=Rhamnella rubrinervis TaxID=2594499 RepID=A0A8K0H9V5_9ROSA|nr:hypothetical protein FNV43_RR08946 [Rhamnella rubrinervis]
MGGGDMRTLTLLLVLKVWFIILVSVEKCESEVFKKNIDCGCPEEYYDRYLDLWFEKDDEYVDGGENMSISTEIVSQASDNLRSFSQGRRNCYTIQVPDASGTAYLISASFLYGNYDNLGVPPTFDLYIGVNYWATVKFRDMSSFVFEDIIHVPTTKTIHVCLVKINDTSGTPFISYLQLRSLTSDSIYQDQSTTHANLRLISRFDFGNNRDEWISRYRGDVYNRIWEKYIMSDQDKNELSIKTVGESAISSTYVSNDQPPDYVLGTAVESNSGRIQFVNKDAEPNSEFYCYLFFTEFMKDAKSGQRKYNIVTVIGNTTTSYGPFESGEYLKPYYRRGDIVTGQGGGLSITIEATPDSKLFPILNALELFQILKVSSPPTHPDDVKCVLEIKQTYGISETEWQGDPCVPTEYSWKGLLCNSANPPRIISLDLSYNNLGGSVPEYLAKLPSLKVLNLRGNKLEGQVPKALLDKSKNKTFTLSLEENPQLCFSYPCIKKGNKKKIITPVAALASSLAIVLAFILIATFWIYKRRTQQGEKSDKKWSCKSKSKKFRYSEVVSITNNFNSIIGEGGFGKVYLGNLNDGTQVAVKLLSSSSKQGHKEFQNEVELLMGVHHKNLVSLIGYCNEGENMAVIYEYMPNGNLRHHISTNSSTNVLTWKKRLQIAIDAARGLEYMHNGCKPPIVHRDLKTSNILLNEKFQAKIADFGLSRVFTIESESHTWTDPKGTFGYLDPQYHKTRMLNKKSDLYSFGVVLLELITGQPAVIEVEGSSSTPAIHIGQWANPMIERDELENIVDSRLHGTYQANSARKAIDTAIACLRSEAVQRPEISWVYNELNHSLEIQNIADDEIIRVGDNDDEQKMDTSSNNISFSSSSSITVNMMESFLSAAIFVSFVSKTGLRVVIIVSAPTQTVALVTIAIVMKGTPVTPTSHKDAMFDTDRASMNALVDIDECKEPEKYPCQGVCENTPGGYTCSCPPGMHGDGRFSCEIEHKDIHISTVLKGIGVVITILIVAMFIIMYWKKRMQLKNFMKNGGAMLKNHIKILTESEIIEATENYRHLLGRGSYGSVFKGKLPNGTQIAVKKANGLVPRGMDWTQIDQQFQREICVISLVNHRNVVKLLALCLESKYPMLVYEYVSNGTVFEHIHNSRSSHFKSWKIVLKIGAETASALNYLHSLADPPIIHRDVKSMNILLDCKLTAKVSDFGTSVFIPPDQSGVATTVQGTIGYLDPEYLTTRILNVRSDVFSFGVVLIELLTGLNPIPNGDAERNIIRQFIAMVEADNLSQNLNVEPADDGELEQIKEVAKLAVKCLNSNRAERPSMTDVAEELDKQMRILNGNSNSQSADIIQELGVVHVPDNIQPPANSHGNASIQMGQFDNKVMTGLDTEIRRSRSRSM